MKKILLALFLIIAFGAMSQNPTYDTVRFKRGGKLYKLITYSDDSININGTMFKMAGGSATNYWQLKSSGHIQPDTSTLKIHYPGIANAKSEPSDLLVRWSKKDSVLYGTRITAKTDIADGDTIDGCEGVYVYSTPATDAALMIDTLANVCDCFIVKNLALDADITLTSKEGYKFDTSSTVTLNYGEWVNICPATLKFTTQGTQNMIELDPTWLGDSSQYYKKTQAVNVFAAIAHNQAQSTITDLDDTVSAIKIHRYSAYSSGNNNVEVLSMGLGITANIANGNELTFTIPAGVKLISAKIRVSGLSSLIIFSGTTDMANDAMSTRWCPASIAWREDTGQQLTGMSTRMDLSDFKKTTINGLISTTICQIRIVF